MNGLRKISVRQLQHNLSDYLKLAQSIPLAITKYGKEEVVVLNPKKFKIVKKDTVDKPSKDIMASEFIGINKNNTKWKSKTSVEIAKELRERAWYGK